MRAAHALCRLQQIGLYLLTVKPTVGTASTWHYDMRSNGELRNRFSEKAVARVGDRDAETDIGHRVGLTTVQGWINPLRS